MADIELQHRVRLALSWRAEARRLDEEARARFEAGTLEAGRFRHLQGKLAAEAAAAQQALDGIRAREGGVAGQLGAHLRDCLGRKSAIAQQVKEGSIAHHTAAAEIGRLDEEIKSLREVVAEFNGVLSADAPEQLGGKIDLPLGEYATRLAMISPEPVQQGGGGRFQRFQLSPRQTRLALVCSAIIMLGMLAVWFIARQNGNIEMVARWSAEMPMEIAVDCANRGAADFVLYVPALDPGATMQPDAFAFEVLHTGPAGRTSPFSTHDAWSVEGRATQYTNPQRILAGKRATYTLHLDRTGPLAPGQHRFEIQCVSTAGRVINRQSVSATLPDPQQ